MSDMIDGFNDINEHRKRLRTKYGIKCPQCAIARPKACATILLPQQRCRVDGYRDSRPELTDEEYGDV